MPVSHYLVRRNPVRRAATSQLYANNAVSGLSHPRFGRVKYVIGPKARPKKAGCSSSGRKLAKCPGNCSGEHQQVSATHSTGCTDMAPTAALIGP